MKLRNVIGIDTQFGYRTFELFEGNLTEPAATADMLVVSAFAGSYEPVRDTLIEALAVDLQIDIGELRSSAEYDLTSQFGFWISRSLPSGPFKRILGIELIGGVHPMEDVLQNIFVGIAMLEAKGVITESVAMPVLGGGSQRFNADHIIAALIPASHRALERSASLRRIVFVDRNHERVMALQKAMDSSLGRVRVILPNTQLVESLRADVLTGLSRVDHLIPPAHQQLVAELRRILRYDQAAAFEVGILGRRVAEFVVDALLHQKKTSPDLAKKIEDLGALGVAPWIKSYLHTLRMLGNESAHEKSSEKRIPKAMTSEDLAVCLFCIQRVVTFLGEYSAVESKASQSGKAQW